MADYRLYFVGGHGRFESVSQLVADDDDAAIWAASTQSRTCAMELWCGTRKVEEWAFGPPERPFAWPS